MENIIDYVKDAKIEEECGLKRIHTSFLRILNEIDKVCVKYNINYSTYGGTMLGHIRHQSFIPWDDDTDVAFTRENFKKFIDAWDKEKHDNLVLSTPLSFDGVFRNMIYKVIDMNCKINSAPSDNGFSFLENTWTDIFIFDKVPRNKIRFKLHIFHLQCLYAMLSSRKKSKMTKFKVSFLEKIAIFVFDKLGKMFTLKHLVHRYEKVSQKYSKKPNNKAKFHLSNDLVDNLACHWHDYEIINDYVRLPFANLNLMTFAHYDYLLKTSYGNNYLFPKISKFATHQNGSASYYQIVEKYYKQ